MCYILLGALRIKISFVTGVLLHIFNTKIYLDITKYPVDKRTRSLPSTYIIYSSTLYIFEYTLES